MSPFSFFSCVELFSFWNLIKKPTLYEVLNLIPHLSTKFYPKFFGGGGGEGGKEVTSPITTKTTQNYIGGNII